MYYHQTYKTLLVLFVLLISDYNSAISQSSLDGKVSDINGAPLAYSNILLLNAQDSSFERGEIADEDGKYSFQNINYGTYFCQASMVGYENIESKVFTLDQSNPYIDLGFISLSENHQLDEITVVAKRPFLEQKVDRTVINVSNSITNAGGNALEVLQKSPGVRVNNLTKTISLAGKEGIVLMINGKISRLTSEAVVQMLEGMTADNIDRIELIHTPPANFEAEGNAGIINIIVKSTGDEGLNGGYALKGGYGKGEKYGASMNANFRRNNINLFGNYSYDKDINPQLFTNYRGVYQGNDFLETETNSKRPYTPTEIQNATFGLDVQTSPKTIIGILGTFFDRNWYMEAVNETTYSKNGILESSINMPNTEINHSRSYSANLNLSHQISDKQNINFDGDIVRYEINNPSNYMVNNVDAQNQLTLDYQLRIDKKTPIDVAVLKTDYTLNINELSKLEAGAKYTTMQFENNVVVDSMSASQYWILLQDYSSLSTLNEDVIGAYSTFSTKLGNTIDVKIGMRYEHTMTNLGSVDQPNIVDRKYGSWFPSVFLTRKFSENKTINLSYSKRITRPQIRQLAPWLVFSDPTTLLGGNSALQPSFTNALKLDYGFNSVRFSLAYSVQDNPIRPLPKVDAKSNRQINAPENLINEKVINMNIYVPLHPYEWWDFTSNVYLNHSETNLNLENNPLKLSNLFYGFNVNNTIKLRNKISLEVSGNYDSPGYFGLAKWKANGSFNIGIQKVLGDKWGMIRFNATDLLQSTNWFGTTNQPENNLLVDVSFQFAERTFMLSYSNTFGNNKLKSSRSRQTGSAEEMKRI